MDNNLLSSTPNPQNNETLDSGNSLWQYVQDMSPDTVAKMSQPSSEEVLKLMERQVSTLLGSLPPEGFGVMITTSREHLGRLLASTMLNGYFLRNVEQRAAIEQALQLTAASAPEEE